MNRSVCFISHPYHRGGVTQWMAHAFNYWDRTNSEANFVSVKPRRRFISGGGRPQVLDLLNPNYREGIIYSWAGTSFELGTLEYRANIYKQLIKNKIPANAVLIPSDDEACWMAACSLAERNPVFAVVHSYGDSTYYQLTEKYYGSLKGVVVVSERIKGVLQAKFPNLNEKQILTQPCGIPIPDTLNRSGEALKRIVWIGRMEEKSKRVSDIPKIVKKLNELEGGIAVEVIGDGEMFNHLISEKQNLGLTNMTLYGWLDVVQIKSLLSSASVLLQTSNYEGMSVSVMEALSCGCAVVSTRVSGVEELEKLEESTDIISLYETGDIDQCVSLLLLALEKFDQLLSERAFTLALNNYDIRKTNENLLRFIKERIEDGGSSVTRSKLSLWRVMISYFIFPIRLMKFEFLKFIR